MRLFLIAEFVFLIVLLMAAGYSVDQISIAFPLWGVLMGAFFAKTEPRSRKPKKSDPDPVPDVKPRQLEVM